MLPTSGIATTMPTMPTSGAALATPVTVPVTTTGVAAGRGEDHVEILMLKIGEFHFHDWLKRMKLVAGLKHTEESTS